LTSGFTNSHTPFPLKTKRASPPQSGGEPFVTMMQGDDLKFQVRPATKPADEQGTDCRYAREHACDTTAAIRKTRDFWPLSEFSVAKRVIPLT